MFVDQPVNNEFMKIKAGAAEMCLVRLGGNDVLLTLLQREQRDQCFSVKIVFDELLVEFDGYALLYVLTFVYNLSKLNASSKPRAYTL